MDMGTIYDRLCSRAFYTSASEYLADVTLMCENAMVYNPPDTIYYQRARKVSFYLSPAVHINRRDWFCCFVQG